MGSVVEDLRRVAAGLRLVFLGLVVIVINAIAAIGVAIAFLKPNEDPATMIAAIHRDYPSTVMVLIGLGVLSNVLAITGKVYCLSIPASAGASPLIVMAVICSGIGLALNVAGQVVDGGASAGEFTSVSSLCTILGYFFFLRFLRRLAAYLGSSRLDSRAKLVLSGSLGLMIVYLAAALGQAAGVLSVVTVVLALLLAIGGLILFGFYTLLIHDLRRTTEATADHVTEQGDSVV